MAKGSHASANLRCQFCPKKAVRTARLGNVVYDTCWGHYRRILRRGTPEAADMRVTTPAIVRKLYAKGLSIREIAEGLEVGKSSVHRALHSKEE